MTTTPFLGPSDVEVHSLHGEWDLSRYDELARELFSLPRSAPRRVVLDLAEVDYIDSRCLAMILQCADRLRRRGGSLSLVVESRCVRRIVDILDISEKVPVHDSVRAAVEHANAAQRAPMTGQAGVTA